jgi:glycosyltransferase involved in cell wall biosynthesis
VVSVSEGIHRLVRAKLGTAGASKAVLVRNGIDAIHDGAAARAPGRPVRILHVGTLYLGRDPRPFLRALAAVVARLGLRPDDVALELVGKGEWFDGVSLKDFAAGLGLEPYVGFVPWLPHAEVERRLREADLLLLLAERQPLQVPNKLYEYLGARRPMLVFADPDGETARMVRAVGGHHLVRSEDPAIDAVVERAITSPPAGPVGSRALLEEWRAERQMAGLVAAVGRLGEPTPAF